MANPTGLYGFRPYKRLGTAVMATITRKAKDNTTIGKGDTVALDSTGYVARVAATGQVLGIAAHGVTGASGVTPDILIYPADESTILVGRAAGTTAITQGVLDGTAYRVTGSAGEMGIDLATSTGGVMQVLGIKPGSELSTNAELLVTIKTSQLTGRT